MIPFLFLGFYIGGLLATLVYEKTSRKKLNSFKRWVPVIVICVLWFPVIFYNVYGRRKKNEICEKL